MTKVRAPLSFALALTTVCGLIGWDRAGKIVRRKERTLRHWSESDRKGTPTLEQAIALDRAFIEQGGGFAPILESYARQLDVSLADTLACRVALGDDIALATRETGEALSYCIEALQPGASPAVIHRAIMETEQADATFPRLLRRLRSLLLGNGAARGATGEI